MSGEIKDQPRATAAQVRAAETLFAIATGTTQTEFLAVTQEVMQEVYGDPATQANLYSIIKALVLGNRAENDTAHTLTIPYAISEIVEVSNPGVGNAWADISSKDYGNDDIVSVSLIEGADLRNIVYLPPIKFSDISTTFIASQHISKALTPQFDGQQNSTTTAITGTYATFVTSTAITPRASTSKFLLDFKGLAGSISGQAKGDLQVQRKIGAGSWVTQSGLSKNYVFLANFGNPPFGYGPIVDSPNTTDTVQYRAQLKRDTTGAHSGTWNCEAFFMIITEIVQDAVKETTLKIRRNGQKLQYRLEGNVSATSELRVYHHN